LTPQVPPSGAAVRLEVLTSSRSGSGLLMQSKGQVVRVEGRQQPPDGVGFAAATGSLKLQNCNPAVIPSDEQYKRVPELGPAASRSQSRKPN
jgi:hypothetical protein